MEQKIANKIMSDLNSLDGYEVKKYLYCGTWVIEINEMEKRKHCILIPARVIEACYKNYKCPTIQNIGNGEEYQRIIIM